MSIKYTLNGVDVNIRGLDSWERHISIYFSLNGEEFLEWVVEFGNGYKLEKSKNEFLADNDSSFREATEIEDESEYLYFTNNLYDRLQEYLNEAFKRVTQRRKNGKSHL